MPAIRPGLRLRCDHTGAMRLYGLNLLGIHFGQKVADIQPA